MAAEDQGGQGVPQLSLPGGQGSGGEAGRGESLPAKLSERTHVLLLLLQPNRRPAGPPAEKGPRRWSPGQPR